MADVPGVPGDLRRVADEVGGGLKDAVEQLDALKPDGLAHRIGLVRPAVVTENLVGEAGLPRHRRHVAVGCGVERIAVEVEGGVLAVHGILAQDDAESRRAVVAGVVALGVGSHVDRGADLPRTRIGCGDDHAGDTALGHRELGLRIVLEAASEDVGVLGGVLEHQHHLDVERVSGAASGVSVALELGAVDDVVLRAELNAREAAGDAHGLVVLVDVGHVLCVEHGVAFVAGGQDDAGCWDVPVVVGVGPEELVVGVRLLDAVVAGAPHHPDVAVGAVVGESVVESADCRDVGLAVVVNGRVDVEHPECVERHVVVASGGGVGADLGHKARVVTGLDAIRRRAERILGELHPVDLAVAVLVPVRA